MLLENIPKDISPFLLSVKVETSKAKQRQIGERGGCLLLLFFETANVRFTPCGDSLE